MGVIPEIKNKTVDNYIKTLSLVRAIGRKGTNLTDLLEGMLSYKLNLLPGMSFLKGHEEPSLLTTCKGLFELLK